MNRLNQAINYLDECYWSDGEGNRHTDSDRAFTFVASFEPQIRESLLCLKREKAITHLMDNGFPAREDAIVEIGRLREFYSVSG